MYDAALVTPQAVNFQPSDPYNVARCSTSIKAKAKDLLFSAAFDTGLAVGLDSVGKNLWGSAVFSTTMPRPNQPSDPYRVAIASDTAIPTALGVFFPPDSGTTTCRQAVQIDVRRPAFGGQLPAAGDGAVRLVVRDGAGGQLPAE